MNIIELINTPRPHTAIAEWAACMICILLQNRKHSLKKTISYMILFFFIFILYHTIAGMLPLYLWIPGMIGAIALIYFFIFCLCKLSWQEAGFCCIYSFVLAEFAASLHWQMYVWRATQFQRHSMVVSTANMLICYTLLFVFCFFLLKKRIPHVEQMNYEPRELLGAASIALVAFCMSNLSFVMPNTPFSSASSSLLYVRTLVDFGGLVMLISHQNRLNELKMRRENNAMNAILQRQYDQYRLSLDNFELLRREFHDIKQYMIAIRAESDTDKKEQYLEEIENAINAQESMIYTGNRVLDVVLATKSAYCLQRNITFNCMADGKLLNFIHVKDICSIFGNALDNAIECVQNISDLENHLIVLNVNRKSQFLLIQCENYSENQLVFKQNLPLTTKADKAHHGYGLKSIQASVQKYGGTMTLHSDNNWFTLQILIPLPE